jgi:hypothetical protein
METGQKDLKPFYSIEINGTAPAKVLTFDPSSVSLG